MYYVKDFAIIKNSPKLSPNLTQAEGFITGVGAKMFTIAGPVIVYGTAASVVYGFIYWIATR